MSSPSMLRLLACLILALLLPALARTQDPLTLEATLSPADPEIGERARLLIIPPDDVEIESLSGGLTGLRIGAYEKQARGTFSADLVPVKPGVYGLEEMEVQARLADGTTVPASLSPFAFTVPDPGLVDTPPDDYTGLFAAERTLWRFYLAGAIVVILAAALLAGLYLIVRRWMRRRAVGPAATAVITDPIDEAFQSLSALENLDEYHTRGTKAHYVVLSMLLRRYIERQWNRPAMEMSEDEVINVLRGEFSHRPGVSDLLKLLGTASLAKFARLEVPIEDVQSHLRSARAFLTSERDRLRAAAMAQRISQRPTRGSEAA
jgi:hypothetical protein